MGRRLAVLVASLLTFVACSTAKPDSAVTTMENAESPNTTLPAATSTTRQQLVDGGLIAVDPATLIPLPGTEPVAVGVHHQGVVSPNRGFAAIETWAQTGETTTLTVIDTSSFAVLASTQVVSGTRALTIDDQGTVYWLDHVYQTMPINVFPIDAEESYRLTEELPVGFFADELVPLDDHRLGLFGNYPQSGIVSGEVSIVVADTDARSVREMKLPSVKKGILGEIETETEFPMFELANPSIVWDGSNNRALVVEATRDVILEVDLESGELTEHPWVLEEAFLDRLLVWLIPPAHAKGPHVGTNRNAVLSPDGRSLYIATSISVAEEGGSRRTPQHLIVVDTEDWAVASVFEAAASDLYPSPDGTHLFAQGAETTERPPVYETRTSPVYLIEMDTRDLIVGYQTTEDSFAQIDFSPAGDFVYISTWSDQNRKIDILDLGAGQLTGSIAFREISLVGRAGLMAFHFEE